MLAMESHWHQIKFNTGSTQPLDLDYNSDITLWKQCWKMCYRDNETHTFGSCFQKFKLFNIHPPNLCWENWNFGSETSLSCQVYRILSKRQLQSIFVKFDVLKSISRLEISGSETLQVDTLYAFSSAFRFENGESFIGFWQWILGPY